ncbi:hypothetical protein QBC41DRAFT_1440 [Cercophora samala]|uniref:Uncharacterized protein n=1 Tax=Cercophora samala TaxID=330535 RepID=A0AA40DF54_9PEZI|nr:hypothetical protein QBC41DRAFT_1440 [Cercophora samala]
MFPCAASDAEIERSSRRGQSLDSLFFYESLQKEGPLSLESVLARQLQLNPANPNQLQPRTAGTSGCPLSSIAKNPTHVVETENVDEEPFYAALCIWLQKGAASDAATVFLCIKWAWQMVRAFLQPHHPIAIIQSPRDPITIIFSLQHWTGKLHMPGLAAVYHHCRRRLLSSEPESSAIATVVSERLEPDVSSRPSAEDPADSFFVDRAPDR